MVKFFVAIILILLPVSSFAKDIVPLKDIKLSDEVIIRSPCPNNMAPLPQGLQQCIFLNVPVSVRKDRITQFTFNIPEKVRFQTRNVAIVVTFAAGMRSPGEVNVSQVPDVPVQWQGIPPASTLTVAPGHAKNLIFVSADGGATWEGSIY